MGKRQPWIGYSIVALDFVNYLVWIGAFAWMLSDQDATLEPYRNGHGRYVAHLFATFTFVYLVFTRRLRVPLVVLFVFALAVIFDAFCVVYVLRFVKQTNETARTLQIVIAIIFLVTSTLMFCWYTYLLCVNKTHRDRNGNHILLLSGGGREKKSRV